MKAQEKAEKDYIKLKFATALNRIINESQLASINDLARETGMEPTHIKRIFRGELDVTLTTAIAIAHALGIRYGDLAQVYDEISEKDIETYRQILKERKRVRGRSAPLSKGKKAAKKS